MRGLICGTSRRGSEYIEVVVVDLEHNVYNLKYMPCKELVLKSENAGS